MPILNLLATVAEQASSNTISVWRILPPFIIFSLIVFYLGRRLICKTSLSGKIQITAWVLLVAITLCFPAIFSYARNAPANAPFPETAYMLVSVLMGYFAYVLFLCFFYDIFLGIFRLPKAVNWTVSKLKKENTKDKQSPDIKHKIKQKSVKSILILATALILFLIGFMQATSQPEFIRREVSFVQKSNSAQSLRIVHLSDTHVGAFLNTEWLREVISKVNLTDPDIVVLTGDFADGKAYQRKEYIKILQEVKAPLHVISGNHEILWGLKGWAETFTSAGFVLLDGKRKIIEVKGKKIAIAGIGDPGRGAWSFKVPGYFSSLLENLPEVDLKILLSHRPEVLPAAAEAGFDLVLAGHTHNGQTLPISLFAKLVTPYPVGFFREGKTTLFVSPGAGYVGPPIRLGVPKEVTILEVFF